MEVKITEHKPLFAYLSSEEARHFRRKYGKNCEVRHVYFCYFGMEFENLK